MEEGTREEAGSVSDGGLCIGGTFEKQHKIVSIRLPPGRLFATPFCSGPNPPPYANRWNCECYMRW